MTFSVFTMNQVEMSKTVLWIDDDSIGLRSGESVTFAKFSVFVAQRGEDVIGDGCSSYQSCSSRGVPQSLRESNNSLPNAENVCERSCSHDSSCHDSCQSGSLKHSSEFFNLSAISFRLKSQDYVPILILHWDATVLVLLLETFLVHLCNLLFTETHVSVTVMSTVAVIVRLKWDHNGSDPI